MSQLQDPEFVVGHNVVDDTWFVISAPGSVVLAGVERIEAEQAAALRNNALQDYEK